jgi:hypothetical protein
MLSGPWSPARLESNGFCTCCPGVQVHDLLLHKKGSALADCTKLCEAETRTYTFNHYYSDTLNKIMKELSEAGHKDAGDRCLRRAPLWCSMLGWDSQATLCIYWQCLLVGGKARSVYTAAQVCLYLMHGAVIRCDSKCSILSPLQMGQCGSNGLGSGRGGG